MTSLRRPARWWHRRSGPQRTLLLALPAFLAGVAVLTVAATGHSLHGTARLPIDAGLLATPVGFCLLNAVRTASTTLPVSLLTGALAVIVGTAVEVVAAYAGLTVAVAAYVAVTMPATASNVVNEIVIAQTATRSLRRGWRALARHT